MALTGTLNREVIKKAVEALVGEGFGQVVDAAMVVQATPAGPLLAIDGDDSGTARTQLQLLGVRPDFHLAVIDLGIETDDQTGYTAEDLELLKDAIRAACTITGGPTPQFPCACGRR